jgi:hypothetical protein
VPCAKLQRSSKTPWARKGQSHSPLQSISMFLKLSKITSIVQQHSLLTAIIQRPYLDNSHHHHEAYYYPLRPRSRHHRPRSPVRRRPRDPICLHRQERKLPPEPRPCPRKRRRKHSRHRRRLQYAISIHFSCIMHIEESLLTRRAAYSQSAPGLPQSTLRHRAKRRHQMLPLWVCTTTTLMG